MKSRTHLSGLLPVCITIESNTPDLISINKLKKQRISIFNRQRKLPIDTRPVHSFLEELTDYLDIEEGFTVVLISDSAMLRYNHQFTGKKVSTDVLSFPVEKDYLSAENYLGDVLISVEKAKNQTELDPLEEEIKVLCLHGVLHLIGYDHETDSGEMRALERQIHMELGLQR